MHNCRTSTHKRHIVQRILDDGELTATDFHYISNANQYFVELERMGILKSHWAAVGRAKMKIREIDDRNQALRFIGKASA